MMKRIKEVINSDGVHNFIPQRKILGVWWSSYEDYYGEIAFNILEAAGHWQNYKSVDKVKIHTC